MITRDTLIGDVLTRLGDPNGGVWSKEETAFHLVGGYEALATSQRVFYDWTYLENLPRGFSYTQPWERAHLAAVPGGFNYGCANYTGAFERRLLGDERLRLGPANHTSPFEATDGLLARAKASTDIPATAEVPKSVTNIDRVSWDTRGIDALSPRALQQMDTRYEITKGEVYGFLWQKDGIRTLRKVRVPAAQATTVTVNGGWGLLRRVGDLTGATVTGTWGQPRQIPGQHPLGADYWGAPRRCFLDGLNVRVEHFRLGRAMATATDGCELPDAYAKYLRNYAQWRLLEKVGPGQDLKLAAHYKARWTRDLARVARRLAQVNPAHIAILGGGGRSLVSRPPRPSLPWNYGTVLR